MSDGTKPQARASTVAVASVSSIKVVHSQQAESIAAASVTPSAGGAANEALLDAPFLASFRAAAPNVSLKLGSRSVAPLGPAPLPAGTASIAGSQTAVLSRTALEKGPNAGDKASAFAAGPLGTSTVPSPTDDQHDDIAASTGNATRAETTSTRIGTLSLSKPARALYAADAASLRSGRDSQEPDEAAMVREERSRQLSKDASQDASQHRKGV